MAPTREIGATLLSRTRGIYAYVDCSKNIKGNIPKEIKKATAVIIGALVTLGQRASGENLSERLEEMAEKIRSLEE